MATDVIEDVAPDPPAAGQLVVEGLDVRYGDVQVLFDVDFAVRAGEIVALLGTNGAGKSTLLKAISGIARVRHGTVRFDDHDITNARPDRIAALGIAQVPGGQGVFPSLTVGENLRAACWLFRRERKVVRTRTQDVVGRFPVLGDRLDDPAADLSGGQQQMLALSMAFLGQPKLLAIDELSLGLAPVVVDQLLDIVRAIRDEGTTVIVVEQSVNVALHLAETAYFMEKGTMRFHGKTADLLERPDILRSVFLEGAEQHLAPHEATNRPGAISRRPRVRPEVAAPPSALGPALRVDHLSVRFGGISAVDEASFTVAEGEVVGVIGPNGAGKTTLLDLISGFTPASGGRVHLGNSDISEAPAHVRAALGLGRSFQDSQLFPSLTVEETLLVALERWLDVRDPLNAVFRLPAFQDSEAAAHHRVDELIDLMGIESFRTKFVGELSTGSRRVVDLACVLAHEPTVVLLDEPSSGIAQREAEALGPLLLRIRDTLGASLVVIEHDIVLITDVANRLVALDQGRVIAEGPCSDVLAHPEVVHSYLGGDVAFARSGTQEGAS
ncbi:MAG: ATP-binding cassette domain-containing protein [Actinomycetota bacterium]|nr:ATP-binding cassette domain-containing protein [Actinomycetota bacterium]